MKNTTKILIAYVLGQITQLIVHGAVMSMNMWDSRRIPFCCAFGFIILFAVIAGVRISKTPEEEIEKPKKSYLDLAKIPGDHEKKVSTVGMEK